MDPARFQYELSRAKRHLEFVVSLYRKQAAAGRYFLHEHPARAASWSEQCIVQLAADYNVYLTTSPMCSFGMVIRDHAGNSEGLALKHTTWMSNGAHIIKELEVVCTGDHTHASLMGKTKQSQVYPLALCKAIVTGLCKQIKACP